MLFVRKEVEDMWDFLEQPARTSMLQGPPGTGKSSSTFVWARKEAAGGKNVLWAHLRKRHAATAAVLQGNTLIVVGAVETTALISLVRSSTADMIVLDGVVSATSPKLLEAADAWAGRGQDRRVVQVTSESVTETGETLKETGTKGHTVPSWTSEQYETAMTNDAFRKEVEGRLGDGDAPREKLINKFFVAGGCARWMFGFTCSEATVDIDKHLDKAKNKQEILQGLQGAKAQDSVNHLIQRLRDSKPCLVSDYVARCLTLSCEMSFVKQALQHARENAGFDGIVLEMDFMAQLRVQKGKSLKLAISDSKEEEWSVEQLINFTKPSDLKGNQVPGGFQNKFGVANGSWLLPKLFNQGGYDAAQVMVPPQSTQPTCILVRFVQVTRSSTHTLKLQYMLALLNSLQDIGFLIEKVEVVFVVPTGRCGAFTLGDTSGDMRQHDPDWRHPAGKEFCDGGRIRVAGLERTR